MSMIIVLIITTIVVSMSALALSIATRSLRSSSQHVTYERALHTAEYGVDQTLARVARVEPEDDYESPTGLVASLPGAAWPSSFASAKAERDYVKDLLESQTPQTSPDGQFAVIKPAGRNVVYAMSWLPNKANAQRSRLIKTEYLLSTYRPANAILTNSTLHLGGNASISGSGGNIHTNGDLHVDGNSVDVEGTASVSGEYHGGPAVSATEGDPNQDVPEVDPLDLYPRLVPEYYENWYDLCPDGSVKRPNQWDEEPCNGTAVVLDDWSYNGGTKTWSPDSDVDSDGVFFVYNGNVKMTSGGTAGSPLQMTLFVASDPSPSASSCTRQYGDLDVSGGVVLKPWIAGELFVVHRDLTITGNPSQRFNGIMAVHEQIGISGNTTIEGAVVAENACDTSGSPVDDTAGPSGQSISGSLSITYNLDLDVALGDIVRTVLWLEYGGA
ncbi:MAG TPA: hypothetical protein VF230_11145 [Acidimicrobiales bacterium]